jgi:BAI1-associated protein 3
MNFQYAGMIYKVYDQKIMELVQPIVKDICNTKIDRLDLLDSKDMKHNRYEEINMLTTLFELYLLLKRFSVLGSALCPGVTEFYMKDYYEWFSSGVAHWLDISVYKALTRIQKAIELDPLIAVDSTVKYSSSAVDTLAIFYQIRIFWQQLAWPNAEGAFIFVSKIVDDICRCCVFYADKMAERVDQLGNVETVYEKKFQVTEEWCLAINNIDYIRQSIHSFVKELGVDDIIRDMSNFRGPMDAQRCSDTLQNVIENAIDTEKNKILELIEKLSRKMNPAMRRFLTEGAELFDTDSNSMDRLMMYMEDSLKILHTELNDDNFARVLDSIWVEISCILFDLVHSSLEKRRPPSFYSNLRSTLQIMVENFKCQSTSDRKVCSSDKETLEKIDRLLELHGYETSDLIHQYYKERHSMQQKLVEAPCGLLTVQCYFQKNTLEIEILNAKNLVPMDSDGSCDPFVRIHFFPEDKFLSATQPKTKVHQKTLFPLFDEKFSM